MNGANDLRGSKAIFDQQFQCQYQELEIPFGTPESRVVLDHDLRLRC